MERVLTYLLVTSFLSIALMSCMEKEQKTDSISYNNNGIYKPGADWELVWSDDFSGETINPENWNFQEVEAGLFNEEWQRYTDSEQNAYIENNQLVIKAIHESDEHGLNQYTSARLNTANKQSWKYGKIAARIKLPYGKGIWPAFWMLGANINENGGDTPWPQSGEIDILELYGTKDDAMVEANIHYADSENKHAMMGAVSYTLDEGIFADDFHIFELEWTKEYIKWFVDGNEYATTDISSFELTEFHEEFFLLLNIAVGGTWAGRPDDSTPFPQYMYVDWIRVYQQK
ncbi:MAG: family 16 glycosylhydrolase [Balneola sp.]